MQFLPIVVVPSLLAWLLGRAVRRQDLPARVPLGLIGAVTVAAGVVVAGWHDRGVHTGAYVGGIVVGAVLIAALPLTAYYLLGRFLPGHPAVGVVVWLVSLAPVAIYLLLALLVTAKLVSCPPDAYECPV